MVSEGLEQTELEERVVRHAVFGPWRIPHEPDVGFANGADGADFRSDVFDDLTCS